MASVIVALLLSAGSVRLHVDTDDPTLRIVDATTSEVVCYGVCDQALPVGPYRTLDRVTQKTHDFALTATAPAGVLERTRNGQLIKTGAIVTGYGAASFIVGAVSALFGWYGSGNGLNPQAWPRTVMDVGGVMMATGIPIAVAGAVVLFFGLRPRYEVQYLF